MNTIKFGTSGWRGIIAEGFTFEGVRVVTQAIADYLKAHHEDKKGIIVGHGSSPLRYCAGRQTAA
ncbi:MAG: hypothetical protein HY265_04895 [Deltaproteobacteria bacterium]|nr:hypothetical protein [Deltaproteobacteria bacterium]